MTHKSQIIARGNQGHIQYVDEFTVRKKFKNKSGDQAKTQFDILKRCNDLQQKQVLSSPPSSLQTNVNNDNSTKQHDDDDKHYVDAKTSLPQDQRRFIVEVENLNQSTNSFTMDNLTSKGYKTLKQILCPYLPFVFLYPQYYQKYINFRNSFSQKYQEAKKRLVELHIVHPDLQWANVMVKIDYTSEKNPPVVTGIKFIDFSSAHFSEKGEESLSLIEPMFTVVEIESRSFLLYIIVGVIVSCNYLLHFHIPKWFIVLMTALAPTICLFTTPFMFFIFLYFLILSSLYHSITDTDNYRFSLLQKWVGGYLIGFSLITVKNLLTSINPVVESIHKSRYIPLSDIPAKVFWTICWLITMIDTVCIH